ncbi:hypothetical protein AB0K34_04975 [Actinomadura sp. NPDC049382]|uniref:hypothetical protein n=1 Tax=Actinomadura sp. NPDC049382 TaxID=3158220 RepID=UPI003429A9EA
MIDEPQLCKRGDGQPVSVRRIVLIGPDGTDRKRCGPYCDPCTDALLRNLTPTFTGGGATYRIDREETR